MRDDIKIKHEALAIVSEKGFAVKFICRRFDNLSVCLMVVVSIFTLAYISLYCIKCEKRALVNGLK